MSRQAETRLALRNSLRSLQKPIGDPLSKMVMRTCLKLGLRIRPGPETRSRGLRCSQTTGRLSHGSVLLGGSPSKMGRCLNEVEQG